MRAKVPALAFPVIMYSIFTNVAFTYGPRFQTTAQGISLIKQLLQSFLTAFAIATGVNLFVIPVTSRTVVLKEMAGYIGAIRGTLKAQTAYLQSLENSDMFAAVDAKADDKEKDDKGKKSKRQKTTEKHPQAKALKGAIQGMTALHGKLHGDLPFAQKETAWGKLSADDLEAIFPMFRGILIPL